MTMVTSPPGAGLLRGGIPWIALLLPGLPDLLARRWGWGMIRLGVWLSLLTLLVWRWDRVSAALGGPLDHRIALFTLLAGLALTWGGALRASLREGVRFPESAGRSGPSGKRADARSPGDAGAPDGSGGSRWAPAMQVFRRNRAAVAGVAGIGILALVALLAPFLAPFDPTLQGNLLSERLLPPSRSHLLGTDPFARDLLSRILYGARISLSIALVAMGIAVTLGTLLGAVAGYLGGWVDGVVARVTDAFLAFPRLVLLIAVVAIFEPSLPVVVAVLGFTQWPPVTRFVRAEVLAIREREYVQAAVALGFSRPRILFRHVLPGALAPVIVAGTLGIGETIVLEAGLSFLGFGVQPPTPSWGGIVAEGRVDLLGAWWISTFSGLAIVLTVVAFNLAGDGLRDALDPRDRR